MPAKETPQHKAYCICMSLCLQALAHLAHWPAIAADLHTKALLSRAKSDAWHNVLAHGCLMPCCLASGADQRLLVMQTTMEHRVITGWSSFLNTGAQAQEGKRRILFADSLQESQPILALTPKVEQLYWTSQRKSLSICLLN